MKISEVTVKPERNGGVWLVETPPGGPKRSLTIPTGDVPKDLDVGDEVLLEFPRPALALPELKHAILFGITDFYDRRETKLDFFEQSSPPSWSQRPVPKYVFQTKPD